MEKYYINYNPIGEGHIYPSFISTSPAYLAGEEDEFGRSISQEILGDTDSILEIGGGIKFIGVLFPDGREEERIFLW